MTRLSSKRALLFLTGCAVFAQTAPELSFEAASLKPAGAPVGGRGMLLMPLNGGPGTSEPGQVRSTNITLSMILLTAYGIKSYQLQGPKWLDSDRFELVAKPPKDATRDQVNVMLQNLLVERFKLALHREQKELPVYALIVGKNGSKMKQSADEPPIGRGADAQGAPGDASSGGFLGQDGFPRLAPGNASDVAMIVVGKRFLMNSRKQTPAALAGFLTRMLDRPVLDVTGLTATYDYTLEFTPERMRPAGAPPPSPNEAGNIADPDPDAGPTIFSALQDQLGLKLEPRKAPVDMLVIDHVERTPIGN